VIGKFSPRIYIGPCILREKNAGKIGTYGESGSKVY
jgi:hypothetical protein